MSPLLYLFGLGLGYLVPSIFASIFKIHAPDLAMKWFCALATGILVLAFSA